MDKFKLLKPFGKYKKGNVFESFSGLVNGIFNDETNEKIYFNNTEYFKLIMSKEKKNYYYIYYKVEKWGWRPKDMGGTSIGSNIMECQDIIDIHPIEFQLECNEKYNKEHETDGGYITREEYMVIHWIKLTKAEYDKYEGRVG